MTQDWIEEERHRRWLQIYQERFGQVPDAQRAATSGPRETNQIPRKGVESEGNDTAADTSEMAV